MNDVAAKLGKLPLWDLTDLYPGAASPELERDLADAQKTAEALAVRYQGKLGSTDGATLAEAIAEYERLEDKLGRIMSFAHLTYARDMTDPAVGKFFQTMQEKVNAVTTHLLFVTLEINRIEDAALEGMLKTPALAHYAPWLRDVRVFRPHQLSDEVEKLLHEKAVAGRSAWVRLFDETVAGLVIPVDGQELGVEQALHLLSEKDAAKRKAAAKALGEVFGKNIRLFALVMNTLAKDKEVEDKWRHLPTPAASRHLGNHVEPEVVGALTSAVRNAYPRLAHRYYALKARWMGRDKLDYWDRNAPLPEAEDRVIPWDEACDIVLDAYGRFSPELARIGKRFFDHAWIDAPARAGKAPGAFAHPTVPSAHPYLLLNYQGKTRDVMTLAHELGHGVHQVLAAAQGPLMADTPLTLAEIGRAHV